MLAQWDKYIHYETQGQFSHVSVYYNRQLLFLIYLQPDLTSTVSQPLHKRAADRFARWTQLTLLAHLEPFLSILFQFQGYSGAALLTPDRFIENDSKRSVMQFFLTLSCGTDLQPACGLNMFEVKLTTSLQPLCLGSQQPRTRACRRLLKI